MVVFALLKNGAFQRDLVMFVTTPIDWCLKYLKWFEYLDYAGYSAGEIWFERIVSLCLIICSVAVIIFFIWIGIEEYKKIWDDIYKMLFMASISLIAVLGDEIRIYVPINLIFIFLTINVGIIFLGNYLKNKVN